MKKNGVKCFIGQFKFVRIFLFAGVLVAYIYISAFSIDDSSSILEEQTRIQNKYEKMITGVIEKIIGPDKAVVLVTAEIEIVKKSFSTDQKAGKTEQATPFVAAAPKRKVLPGFDEEVATEVQQQSAGTEKSAGVSKKDEKVEFVTVLKLLKVTILLDAREQAKKGIIENAIKESVGLDIGGANKLKIEIKDAPFTKTPVWEPFIKPAVLVPLILGIIFLIVLVGPLQSVLRSFASAFRDGQRGGEFTVLSKSETKNESTGTAAGSVAGGVGGYGGVTKISTTKEEEEDDEEMKKKEKPFAFITRDNIKNLIYLIQEEPPEVIALIVTYLDSELSADVISSLPSDLQLQTAICIANVKLTSEEDVYNIHEKIKKKIDFLVGGIDAFIRIIEQVDNRVRKEMLDTLEKQSPRLAKRVRENIFMFEDFASLPDQTVQFVLREIKTDQLAVALKGAGVEAVMQKVLGNMSEGGRLLLKEEMDFGRPVTAQQIEEIQREIEKVVKKMEKEKKIVLKKVEKDEQKGIEIEGRLQKLDLGDEYNKTQPATQQPQSQGAQPQRSNVSPQRAIEYYNAGITAYSSGKIDDAIHYFQRSVSYNPNFWQAWQYLGSCLYSKGRIDEALSAYEKSLAANSSNTQLRDWLQAEKRKRTAAK